MGILVHQNVFKPALKQMAATPIPHNGISHFDSAHNHCSHLDMFVDRVKCTDWLDLGVVAMT